MLRESIELHNTNYVDYQRTKSHNSVKISLIMPALSATEAARVPSLSYILRDGLSRRVGEEPACLLMPTLGTTRREDNASPCPPPGHYLSP